MGVLTPLTTGRGPPCKKLPLKNEWLEDLCLWCGQFNSLIAESSIDGKTSEIGRVSNGSDAKTTGGRGLVMLEVVFGN